jgi:DNA polymerase III delta prime subunit
MLSAAKTSESDTPSVFYCEIAPVFDNSDAFTALRMTNIFNSENCWLYLSCEHEKKLQKWVFPFQVLQVLQCLQGKIG